MSEEHGYQRSGKKCREKFENLYKYYKKTKEGKAGRQDGKHYRFFRQLEALYGDATNSVSIQDAHYVGANAAGSGFRFHTSLPTQANHQEPYNQSSKPSESLSLSNNSSEFDSTSSEEDNNEVMVMDNESSERRNSRKRRGGGGRNWKAKIKEFIDSQMRKLMEKQEAWLEKLMGNLEEKERERNVREEEWRREEAARIEREHRFWAKERAWIEARDSALMEALHKLTGKEIKLESSPPSHHHRNNNNEERSELLSKAPAPEEDETWEELEIARLLHLKAGMESRFGGGYSEEVLWEDIAEKMGQMGYERSALMCKDKWESISSYKTPKEFSQKRKDNSRACLGGGYFRNNESTSSLYNHGGGGGGGYCELNEQGGHANNDASSSSPSNPNLANAVHDPCFPFLMSEGDNLWENYGLKLNKGGQNQ